MTTIITPFAGLRYSARAVPDLGLVMTPPYDVISEAERAAYMARSPYSMIHLILGAEDAADTADNNRFSRAAALLQEWRRTGVLVPEAQPALYLYQQDFTLDGQMVTRTGFISRVQLADYQAGVIFPHEQTFAGPKADLLRLWQACRANLSQIFAVYLDAVQTLEAVLAPIRAQPPGLVVPYWGEGAHRLWVITDADVIAQVQHAMHDTPLVIADGHHRYETALALRDDMRRQHLTRGTTAPYDSIMMYCANIYDPGVLALPTHRLVHHMPVAHLGTVLQSLPWVQVEVHPRHAAGESLQQWQRRLEGLLRQRQGQGSVFALYAGGDQCHLVTVPAAAAVQQVQMEGASEAWKQLDVSVLHHALLPSLRALLPATQSTLTYARANDEILQTVADGRSDLAVLMNPTPVEAMATIAMGGERMPQKSTYFYPKLPTGLVINGFES
jgi:uncharacterized protein (DUF1015 family)